MTLSMAAIGLFGVATVACSDESATSEPSTTAPSAPSTTRIEAEADPGPVDSTIASTTTSTSEPESLPTSSSVPETIATVPEAGVPGIESDDAFCRAWGEFAGSFQALALVASVGGDPVAASRLEVVASAAVVSAAMDLSAALPDDVEVERSAFVDGVIGPFARRANRATDELRAIGLSNTELDQLGDAWLAALIDAGVDDAEIGVVVPVDLSDAVDTATVVFVAEVPAIADDPSLVTTAAAPATFAHLADNCPDQGILGGNDAID